MEMKLKIEYRKVSDLLPYARNARMSFPSFLGTEKKKKKAYILADNKL